MRAFFFILDRRPAEAERFLSREDFAGATCFLFPPSPLSIVSSEYRSTETLRATKAEGVSVPPSLFLADLVCGVPTGILRSRKKIFRQH